ncbi:MAG: AAA family ATPase [Gammaproteobacteria bacterium]|nr:AAA family ATPase [Gammaproteobacteria bacterium]
MTVDIIAAFQTTPPQLDFIWPGFLAGTVGALIAPGATGKSFWALEAAMSVACNVPGGDLVGLSPEHTGRVVYIAGEDPIPSLTRRVHAIGKHLSPDARYAIAYNLTIKPIIGQRFNLMNDKHLAILVEYCTNSRLLVLDTLNRIHQLDENSNSDMSRLLRSLEYVSSTTGCAILFLHHTSKGSARDGQLDQQQAARGASALIDNTRWCGFVAKMTKEEAENLSEGAGGQSISENRRGLFVRFGISKQNYDVTPLDRWYKRCEGGVLLPAELMEPKTSSPKRNARRYRDGF